MMKIAHLGYGWLAKLFEIENLKGPIHSITFYNRSPKEGAITFALGQKQKTPDSLKDSEVLIVTLPPGKNLNEYQDSIQELTHHWPLQKPILFMSTTSVFPSKDGVYTEEVLPLTDNPRSEKLVEIENFILKSFSKAIIIRSGGQVGPDRHPLRYLAKNHIAFQGNERINFIHSDDLCSLLFFLLKKIDEKETIPSILHAVSPKHPTKMDYYQEQAKLWSLQLPEVLTDSYLNRVIESKELTRLGYVFKRENCLVDKL